MNRLLRLPVIVTVIAALLFIILAARVTTGTPPAFDTGGLAWFAGHSSTMATGVFRLVTWAGSIFFLAPVVTLASYILYRYNYRSGALVLASSFAAAAIAARLLKYLIARERPDVYPALVDTITGLAFPSVHAAQVSAFCLALYLVLRSCRLAWHAIAGAVLLVSALVVMCSRLYLQVHYPSDIIGGALVAIICVLGSSMLFRNTASR